MAIEQLTDPKDPRIAGYRGVAEPELVRSRGMFVAEGRLVVRRLIEDGRVVLHSVLVSHAAFHSLEGLLAPLAAQLPIYVCAGSDFTGITGYNIHRGCVALAERPPALTPGDVLGRGASSTVVVLEGVTNADNIGGVFRNAAAFRADAVLLSPTCCDPLYRKAIRTSMAATLRLPFARVENWPAGLEALHAAGFAIAALTPGEPSVPLGDFIGMRRPDRVAILAGAEGDGLSPDALRAADVRLRIPIAPEIDSLNLAVAVGIVLHRLSS